MNVWAVLREHAHVILLAMAMAVVAISAIRRGRRPSNEELGRLAKSLLGTASSLFVIVWLVSHKNSDLDGLAILLMVGLLPYLWNSLCTGYDTIIEMCSREIPAVPPPRSENPVKARIAADISHDDQISSMTSEAKNDSVPALESEAEVEIEADVETKTPRRR